MRHSHQAIFFGTLVSSSCMLLAASGCASGDDSASLPAPDVPTDAANDSAPDASTFDAVALADADAAPPPDDAFVQPDYDAPPPLPPCGVEKKTHVVQVLTDSFSPRAIAICPGDAVQWVWQADAGAHSVVSGDYCNEFGQFIGSDALEYPAKWSHVFTTPNFYPYYSDDPDFQACIKMQGYVTVRR